MASLKYYNKTTKQWEHVSSDSSDIVTDSTLTQAGQAADAKVVGDLLAEKQPKGNYLTEIPDTYATEEFVKNKIAEAELGGEEVDLSGYAQKSELPTKVSQLQNDAGYLNEHQDISGKLDASELPTAINTALALAKESGEFDGKDGQDGKDGVDGTDGISPHVGNNGNWFIGDNDTGIPATGPAGGQGLPGTPGEPGKDGTSATHSWNGTVLTVTSASGTSSADLKGDKGEQGESGVWVGSEAPVDDSYSVWIDPTGENSGGNANQGGLTTEQITALDNMFKVCAFIQDDVSAEYTAFKTAFGITDSGDDSGEDSGGDEPHTHSYTSSVTTAATCTTAGVRTYTCSCGESYTEAIPATGHIYVDGVCTVCGHDATEIIFKNSDDVTFESISVLQDGTTNTFDGWRTSEYIDISPYSVTILDVEDVPGFNNNGICIPYVTFYDSDKNFIGSVSPSDDIGYTDLFTHDRRDGYIYTGEITVPDGTHYIRVANTWGVNDRCPRTESIVKIAHN